MHGHYNFVNSYQHHDDNVDPYDDGDDDDGDPDDDDDNVGDHPDIDDAGDEDERKARLQLDQAGFSNTVEKGKQENAINCGKKQPALQ